MAMKRNKSIQDSLQFVADHPRVSNEAPIDTPVWELVARQLFKIANEPDKKVRGSMARATKAQKIILDRLVGKRRPGTHPAQAQTEGIDFVDLTMGVLE
jgi:hypothetical protein